MARAERRDLLDADLLPRNPPEDRADVLPDAIELAVVGAVDGVLKSNPNFRYYQTIGWQKAGEIGAHHTTPSRVSWHDTDASGRIHFTAAFRWAEAAEAGLMRAAGVDPSTSIDYPRRKVEAEYLIPLRFDDAVETKITVDRIGRTSLTLAWDVTSRGRVAIRGLHTIVRVDGAGRPKELDAEIGIALGGAGR